MCSACARAPISRALITFVNCQQGGTGWTLSTFAGDTKLGGGDGQADGPAAIQRDPGTADRAAASLAPPQFLRCQKEFTALWLNTSALFILGKQEVAFGLCSNECARAEQLLCLQHRPGKLMITQWERWGRWGEPHSCPPGKEPVSGSSFMAILS